jgi:hypothetical protein
LTFIQFLEDLEQSQQTAIIAGPEVERLAQRFGSKVRGIGFWNSTGDGSVEVPMANITQAAKRLGNLSLSAAVEQLRSPDQFTGMLSMSSAAGQLIEALHGLYLEQFQERVQRYQNSHDAGEAERLRHEISRDLFGA